MCIFVDFLGFFFFSFSFPGMVAPLFLGRRATKEGEKKKKKKRRPFAFDTLPCRISLGVILVYLLQDYVMS